MRLRSRGCLAAPIVLTCLCGATAAAEPTGGTLAVTVTSPSLAQGRIDCQPGAGCRPMNAAACSSDAEPRDIRVRVSRGEAALEPEQTLFVWLQDEGECVLDAAAPRAEQSLLDELPSPLASAALDFPEDLTAQGVSLATTDLLHGSSDFDGLFPGACSEATRQEYRLCFGIDTGAGDRKIAAAEPVGWLRLLVDTEAPPPPATAGAEGLDGTVRVTGALDAVDDPEDVYRWAVIVRRAPEGTAGVPIDSPSDCRTWADARTATQPFADGRLSLELAATNGAMVEGCAYLIDDAGNEGTPSPTFYATPIDECDFVECYPGELRPGHCAAGATPSLALMLLLSAAWRRRSS